MRPLSVLIVDDNPRMRTMLRAILGDRAERVVECADGLEAVAVYPSVSPDVVLMDIAMPRLDGIGALARIRADDPTARIVIVSEYDDAELHQVAAAAGAAGYVTKDDLARVLDVLE